MKRKTTFTKIFMTTALMLTFGAVLSVHGEEGEITEAQKQIENAIIDRCEEVTEQYSVRPNLFIRIGRSILRLVAPML